MADLIDNVLIIDTETNGMDIEKNQVIEVGAILYSVRYQTILQQISFLLPAKSNDMKKINHIPVSALTDTVLSCMFFNFISRSPTSHNTECGMWDFC